MSANTMLKCLAQRPTGKRSWYRDSYRQLPDRNSANRHQHMGQGESSVYSVVIKEAGNACMSL